MSALKCSSRSAHIDFLLCEKFRTFLCVHSGRTKSLFFLKKRMGGGGVGVARSAALSILSNPRLSPITVFMAKVPPPPRVDVQPISVLFSGCV